MKGREDFYETNCVICGKPFCMADPDMWAYRTTAGDRCKQKFCCSWHCLQTLRKRSGRVGKKAGKKDELFRMMREGMTDPEIAQAAEVSVGTVRYWRIRFIE